MDFPDKVKQKIRRLPDKPGCYMMRDSSGRIIYVGKAASLRKRVMSYFRQATLRRGSPKLRGLVRSVRDLDYIVLRNEAEAALTEGRLIKEYKPRYNVSFKDDKRFLLLKANPRQDTPRFELCRIKRDDGARYFGPYVSSAAARAALDFVEKTFGIRKCSPAVPDKSTYRHCINDIVRYCSAPCIGKISAGEYRARFEEACAFLRGERPGYLKEMKQQMQEAAEEKRFEDAAAIRDTYMLLREAVKQKNRIASTPEMQKEEAWRGLEELSECLGLDTLPRVIEAYDVSNISGSYSVASMVCFVDGMPQRNRYRRFRIKTLETIDDPRMIAEAVQRRFERLLNEGGWKPGLIVIDGGRTQLAAARNRLTELQVAGVDSIGLAKRFEEIYAAPEQPPVRLPPDSAAIKVLQRIRDEAHRFAIDYHRRIRSRRIRESVLDDISGVGPARKRELLERFGSVKKLTKAREEDIAAIRGIGPKLAGQIIRELKAAEGRSPSE
jgi:excinuclease ABC subunit C